MILVDVYLPVVDRVYDFNLDESKPIGMMIVDIVDMICQKEQWQPPKNMAGMALWVIDEKRKLPGNSTLAANRIVSGMRLMLV